MSAIRDRRVVPRIPILPVCAGAWYHFLRARGFTSEQIARVLEIRYRPPTRSMRRRHAS